MKFRPTMMSLESRENPSGPDLMENNGLPTPPPVVPPQETPPTPPPGGDVVPSNPNNPAG